MKGIASVDAAAAARPSLRISRITSLEGRHREPEASPVELEEWGANNGRSLVDEGADYLCEMALIGQPLTLADKQVRAILELWVSAQ